MHFTSGPIFMKKILLLEDDRNLGQTLSERLKRENFEVVWVRSIAAAKAEILNRFFDLQILDIGLPDGSGLEWLEQMNVDRPSTPTIFVTAQGDAETRLKGYELGAEEFVPKPFHLKELLLRVHHVLEKHLPQKRVCTLGVIIDWGEMTIKKDGKALDVAAKDFAVLKVLVQAYPRVVSRDEILNTVWGQDKFPTPRTVDNTVVRLRLMFGDGSENAIISVRGVGYKWNAIVEESR